MVSRCAGLRRYADQILLRRTGEQQQVSVGVLDDEGLGTPRLLSERLIERDTSDLKLAKICSISWCVSRPRSAESRLSRSREGGVHHLVVDAFEVEEPPVSFHLGVEGRFPICEYNRKPKLLGEEVARCLDVGDEQFIRRGCNDRL